MRPSLRQRVRNRLRPLAVLGTATALASLSALATAPPATAADGWLPVPYSVAGAVVVGNLAPNTPPPGANDWSCRPSAAHPYPVVLTHGTLSNERMNGDSLSPFLHDNGYCVFTLNYGGSDLLPNKGLWSMQGSADTLRRFVDQVLAATGAPEVDIVGHSQGGLMPRYYLKYLGGAAKVHTLVGLGPTNHGGTVSGLVTLLDQLHVLGVVSDIDSLVCDACSQQLVGSDFLADLNAGGDTVPGVRYTVIASKYDEFASPYTNDFLSGPNVTNITLQDGCPIDFSGHLALPYRPRALTLVLNALDPAHPKPVPCLFEPATG
ncbi:esterase/lipase family protein [Kitasatospora phosalacinea]|uniref:Esterase/lipase family protein n=1 Tax=Kitasatospora phosalacinea TaxID=2065 RepID=A0ABW6GV31_9ACTN